MHKLWPLEVEVPNYTNLPIGPIWLLTFHLLGLSETPHILRVDTTGLSPSPTSLFFMFACHHIFLYFRSHFGDLNVVILSFHIQIVNRVKFWQHNVYLSEITFQLDITHLKRRLYAKVTALGSWGTKLHQLTYRAHVNFGVSPSRVRFLDV